MIKKIIYSCITALLISSCSSTTFGDSGCMIIPMTPMMASTSIKDNKELAYPKFSEEPLNPASVVANRLFQDIICSQETESYGVKYTEVEIKTEEIYSESWFFNFTHNEAGSAKPTLYLYFFACEGSKGINHCQDLALSRYSNVTELKIIKSEFDDSIIALKTKGSDTELYCVCRVINGPNNMRLVVMVSDNVYAPSIAKEEIIARVQNLTRDDIFPNELLRYKVDENLRDLELQFATTLIKRDNFQNECPTCAKLLKSNEATAHVIVKSNIDADQVRLVLGRPLVSEIVQEKTCSLQAMKEQELCIGSQSVLPGERVSLSVQDSKGIKIESYEFCPNPIIARSSLDDGQIIAEIFDKDCFLLTSNLKEKLCVESVSAYEVLSSKIDCTKEDMHLLIAPAIKDMDGGVALVTITRESGEELKVSLPWGTNRDYMLKRLPKIKANL